MRTGAAMNLRHFSIGMAIELVACSGGLADPETKTTPPPAPTESPAPRPAPSPTSTGPAASGGIVGVFHHGKLAATNLALRADGTFTWTMESSCGDLRGQCGTWEATSSGVVLAADDAVRWIETGEPMKSVLVQETREGVEVTGIARDGVTLHQSWPLGRMCPVCRGGPGPATEAKCEAPLPDVCGR